MNTQYPHLLVAKEGPSAGKIYPLEEDEVLIGREQGSTLQIDSSRCIAQACPSHIPR